MSLDALVGKLVSAQQEARAKLADAQAQATQTVESAAAPVVAPKEDAVTPVQEPKAQAPATETPAAEAPKAEAPAEAPAATEAPAAEVPATGDGKARPTFKAVSVDDQGVIYGIGSMVTVDREGEIVQKGALLQLAYDFCASKGRQFLANHDKDVPLDAELVASMPGAPVLKSGRMLKAGESLPDDDPVVAINIEKGNEIAWVVGVRPRDERIIAAAKSGDLRGFSWGGFASKE